MSLTVPLNRGSLANSRTSSRIDRLLRDWMIRSDAGLDPQAMILTPENCIALAGAIERIGFALAVDFEKVLGAGGGSCRATEFEFHIKTSSTGEGMVQ